MPQPPTQEVKEEVLSSAFLSPIGIIMMGVALFADVSEALIELIPIVGPILSVIIDIGALLIIGGWMYLKSGILKAPQKTAARVGKAAKWAKRLKWLRPLCIVIEMIPIVGSAPAWTIAVYLELKYG